MKDWLGNEIAFLFASPKYHKIYFINLASIAQGLSTVVTILFMLWPNGLSISEELNLVMHKYAWGKNIDNDITTSLMWNKCTTI